MAASTDIKDRSDYEYRQIEKLTRGINLIERADLIEPIQVTAADNLVPVQEELVIDTGYGALGVPLRGKPQLNYEFAKANGIRVTYCITTATVYKWNSSIQEWQYIADGTDTVTSLAVRPEHTDIPVDDETGFSTNDYIGIFLASGKMHFTQVASTSAGVINITEAIPGSDSVALGAAVYRAPVLIGTVDFKVDYVIWPPDEWLIFTNNLDTPKYIDTDDDSYNSFTGLPASFRARIVDIFKNHIIFGNTWEAGIHYPQRYRNCDTGDPTEWTTGNANFVDLYDTPGIILDSAPLGNNLMLYKSDSYVKLEFIGTEDKLFDDTHTVIGPRILGTHCVVPLKDTHLIFTAEGIRRYDGSLSDESISLRIDPLFIGRKGNINWTKAETSFAVYIDYLEQIFFFYPSGGAELPNNFLRYDRIHDGWFTRTFSETFIAANLWRSQANDTWDSLTIPWNIANWPWDRVSTGGLPMLLLSGAEANQVHLYDFLSPTDNGVDIPYYVETADFDHAQGLLRLNHLRAMLRGHNVFLDISFDNGNSWEHVISKSPGDDFMNEIFSKEYVRDRMRFRLRGTGGNFGIRWITPKLREETEY